MKRKFTFGALACALSLLAPLGASAADEATTTTVEIEISATSIASDTPEATEPDEVSTDETLPFTGPTNEGLALVGMAALLAGIGLVGVSSRSAGDRSTSLD